MFLTSCKNYEIPLFIKNMICFFFFNMKIGCYLSIASGLRIFRAYIPTALPMDYEDHQNATMCPPCVPAGSKHHKNATMCSTCAPAATKQHKNATMCPTCVSAGSKYHENATMCPPCAPAGSKYQTGGQPTLAHRESIGNSFRN